MKTLTKTKFQLPGSVRVKKSAPLRPWMLRKELLVLYFALKDKRTPIVPKFITLVAVLYLLSPIDIIPDFIPVVGYLDDMVIVPLLLSLAIKLLPVSVREESMLKASRQHKKFMWITILIVLLIAAMIAATVWLIWYHH
jgi:uncharacterized membrane protein YkvA (DUF1232 family)